MSSFPRHVCNVLKAKKLGIDVTDHLDENGEVTLDSWHYDELICFCEDLLQEIAVLKSKGGK